MSFEGHSYKKISLEIPRCFLGSSLPSDETAIFSRGFFNGDASNEMNGKMREKANKQFPFEDGTKLGQFHFIFFISYPGATADGKEKL